MATTDGPRSPRSMVLALVVFAGLCAPALAVDAPRKPRPSKNVILMISDGWGQNIINATRFFSGKTAVYDSGEWSKTFMSTYPGSTSSVPGAPREDQKGSYDPGAMWKTFDYAKSKATDSAAAGTALATGVKTYNNAIGLDMNGAPLVSVAEIAKRAGKSAGVVTTVQWSHATPAVFCAHNLSRNNYEEIAQEILTKSGLDVVIGAGHPEYDDDHQPASMPHKYVGGAALWSQLKGGNLVGADVDGDGAGDKWFFVENKSDFLALRTGPTPKRVLGTLQVHTTAHQARSERRPRNDVPTLADLSLAALNVLNQRDTGFFLMIEGGAVDWAGHANQKERMIEEQMDFDAAVEAVVRWVEANSTWDETLLIVTGDHETGCLWGPNSGTVNGSPVWNEIVDKGPGVLPGMEFHSKDHTNSLVPLFARGGDTAYLISLATRQDPRRGAYLDNTDVGRTLKDAVGTPAVAAAARAPARTRRDAREPALSAR